MTLRHFEYSPHLQVLAQRHASGTRLSKTASDLLSFIPLASYDITSSLDQSKRLIPARRREPAAVEDRVDGFCRPAGELPTLPAVPVMMHTLPDRLPDIRHGPEPGPPSARLP